MDELYELILGRSRVISSLPNGPAVLVFPDVAELKQVPLLLLALRSARCTTPVQERLRCQRSPTQQPYTLAEIAQKVRVN
jgi:hypothetical protein